MSKASEKLNVFVSSTSEDLTDFRAATGQVVSDLGWVPEMMEHFGALPTTSVQACLSKIAKSDLMVSIIAFRRGWVPTPEQGGNGSDSISALELAEARRCGIPVILMLAHKDLWPGRLYEESEEARAWVNSFREGLNQPAQFFDFEQTADGARESLPVFRAKLRQALLAHQEVVLARRDRSVKGSGEPGAAVSALKRGALIPFVGPGVYEDGPLGRTLLARALDSSNDSTDLATAAELREGGELSRANFISVLSTVLKEQSSNVTVPNIVRVLAEIANHRLVISTCLDDVLEQQLRAAGGNVTTIAHVMSSFDGEHDGKVVVLRDGEALEICPPREVKINCNEVTIYKLLGTPLLEACEAEQIDTTVITESDHLLLLRCLANSATSIPPAIVRILRQHPLLFLGYDLDLWQYRLVLQLFQTIGRPAGPIAARQPASAVETNAWRRLQINLLSVDANGFADQALAATSGEAA